MKKGIASLFLFAAVRIIVLSAIILAKNPSEYTQRGFFLFGAQKKAPKMHQILILTLWWPYVCHSIDWKQTVQLLQQIKT